MIKSGIVLPSNKKFGFFFTLIFSLLSVYLFHFDYFFATFISVTTLFSIFFITLFKSEILLPFNKSWMMIGIFIGSIVNPIIMGVLYFGIFTPLGFFMRLFGRDELSLKFEKKNTYWKNTVKDFNSEDTFKNQF